MNKLTQDSTRRTAELKLPQNLARYGLLIIAGILISSCANGTSEANLLSNARNTSEAEEILGEVFTLGATTATELSARLKNNDLNCIEMETVDYDPALSENYYDGWIVCWLPAPNVEARTKLDWLNALVVKYVFRTIFLFNGEILSDIRVILDDQGL